MGGHKNRKSIKHQIKPHYYVPICDYCGKLIKENDYMVHLRYLAFVTIHDTISFYPSSKPIHTKIIRNEYYHRKCYDKLQKQLNTNGRVYGNEK